MARSPRRIGIVGFDRVQGLDLSGPLDVFASANERAGRGARSYEILVLGVTSGSFTAQSGLRLLPHLRLDAAPPLDTLIIPGGGGVRENTKVRAKIAHWLRSHANRTRRIASVCTGIYALAESGLLDGRRATTHWRFTDDVSTRWPAIQIDANAIFIQDDRYYTSAGITAGIDLALALVEEDLGSEVSLAVARDLVVYLKRSGGQLQYSEPLRAQMLAKDEFSDVVAWMRDHLNGELSVEKIAERLNVSERHVNRKFKAAFGCAPGDFIESLRLDEARWLLASGNLPIERLAAAIGYRSSDVFRRAFERRFGVVPSDYRGRFSARPQRELNERKIHL